MRKIQDIAGFLFIVAVSILSLVSVLGIWNFFSREVITKSFQTLGLLAVVAVIVIIAGRFIEGRQEVDILGVEAPNEFFKIIRRTTLTCLIVFASLLALLGVLAIWDVITDKNVLYKSIGTLATLSFGSFIIVMTCLERENNPIFKKQGKSFSVGAIVLIIIGIYLFFSFSRYFW